MQVAPLRPAATVVVVREAVSATSGFEVLMVRRNDNVAFMAGAYVFPGGRVDDADATGPASDETKWPSRFPDLSPAEEQPYRRAAARELEEEASVRVNAADLYPIAHWVTPEIEIRRFDTRFFLIRMPDGQEARHDASETTALEWLTPQIAIDRSEYGDILLPPPTWTTLKRLARARTVDELLAWARTIPIVRVEPKFLRDEMQTLLTLPGDPTYPTIEGWEVPEETRFLLREGRWRPVPV